jgi:hypothetical protein
MAAESSQTAEYILDPTTKNEFYRLCISLKIDRTCFGNLINS